MLFLVVEMNMEEVDDRDIPCGWFVVCGDEGIIADVDNAGPSDLTNVTLDDLTNLVALDMCNPTGGVSTNDVVLKDPTDIAEYADPADAVYFALDRAEGEL